LIRVRSRKAVRRALERFGPATYTVYRQGAGCHVIVGSAYPVSPAAADNVNAANLVEAADSVRAASCVGAAGCVEAAGNVEAGRYVEAANLDDAAGDVRKPITPRIGIAGKAGLQGLEAEGV
jgi:hypothetical protein